MARSTRQPSSTRRSRAEVAVPGSGFRQTIAQLVPVENRVSADVTAGGLTVVLAPGVQQRIRLGEDETVVRDFDPFPVEQRFADIAYVPEAGVGCLGQVRDAPCAGRVAQENPEDCARPRSEQ